MPYPNLVSEPVARVVAGCVVVGTLFVYAFHWHWLAPLLAFGFALRVANPAWSPLVRLSRLLLDSFGGEHRMIPSKPKRFAAGLGLIITVSISSFFLAGSVMFGNLLCLVLIFFAGLESIFNYCVGCQIHHYLIQWRLLPESWD